MIGMCGWISSVRSAMRAASQLPAKEPTDVDDAPTSVHLNAECDPLVWTRGCVAAKINFLNTIMLQIKL